MYIRIYVGVIWRIWVWNIRRMTFTTYSCCHINTNNKQTQSVWWMNKNEHFFYSLISHSWCNLNCRLTEKYYLTNVYMQCRFINYSLLGMIYFVNILSDLHTTYYVSNYFYVMKYSIHLIYLHRNSMGRETEYIIYLSWRALLRAVVVKIGTWITLTADRLLLNENNGLC